MKKNKKSQALFLDRDGVINVDTGYVHTIEAFKFIEGIFELTHLAHTKNYLIFVVTNQAGIGRGYYSEKDFNQLTSWMIKKFSNRNVPIQKVYHSPYHPVHGVGFYKKDDEMRKPKPGMIKIAQKEFNLDLDASVLIGDKQSDIEAGKAAGVGKNILLSTSHDIKEDNDYNVVKNLKQARQYL